MDWRIHFLCHTAGVTFDLPIIKDPWHLQSKCECEWVTLCPALAPGSDWLRVSGLCCHAWLVMKLSHEAHDHQYMETHWHILTQIGNIDTILDDNMLFICYFLEYLREFQYEKQSINQVKLCNLLFFMISVFVETWTINQTLQYLATLCRMNGIVNQFSDFMFLRYCKTFKSIFTPNVCLQYVIIRFLLYSYAIIIIWSVKRGQPRTPSAIPWNIIYT